MTIGIDVLALPDLASSGAYMYDMPPVGCPLPVLVVVYEVDQYCPTPLSSYQAGSHEDRERDPPRSGQRLG